MRSIFAPPFVVCRRIFVSSYESGGESERAVDQKERFDPIPTVSLLLLPPIPVARAEEVSPPPVSLYVRPLAGRRSFRFVRIRELVAKATAAKGLSCPHLKPINI